MEFSLSGRILSNCRSEYRVKHHYQGKVKGVVLDWAGTVLDCGVYSPAIVFMEVFKREGVPITIEEAREPMGTHKMVHIRRVTQNESVRKRWFENLGRYPNEDDVKRMFDNFIPMQVCVAILFISLVVIGRSEGTLIFFCRYVKR